ncbi:MAG: hypothetical protein ABIQ44_04340, partial [Chloroflexia bacterium]
AVGSFPQNEEPALALAQAYLATGYSPKAAQAAQRAVAADASSLAAHELLLAALSGDASAIEAENRRWAARKR